MNRHILAAAAFFLAATMPAWAQVPRAGDVLRETQPPPRPMPSLEGEEGVVPQPGLPAPPKRVHPGASVKINAIRFSGNTIFSEAELHPLVSDVIGRTVTIAELDEMTARITAKYRDAGYPVAQAYLPRQDLTAGNLEIGVLEGRVGKVTTDTAPEAPISDQTVRGFLRPVKPGEPLRAQDMERAMLLLSDLPGIAPQAALEQGDDPGTVDLQVEIKPQRPWDLSATLDNYGSESLGEYRLGLIGRLNSPFKIGDNLDLNISYAFDGDVNYGRIGYEAPLGYSGLRAGIGYSYMTYEVTDDFDAIEPEGTAEVFDLSLNYPLIRRRHQNVVLGLVYEHKKLNDETILTDTDKTVRILSGAINFETNDHFLGGGFSGGSLRLSFGDLDLNDPVSQAADEVSGLNTRGHFTRLNYRLSRLNTLYGPTMLFLAISGQLTNENLDSAEKIALGGASSVRSYSSSHGVVDEGHVLNAELRYTIRPDISAFVFYDRGWGHLDHNPPPGEANSVRVTGYGLGFYWSAPERVYVQGTIAWADGSDTDFEEHNRRPRIFFQVSKAF